MSRVNNDRAEFVILAQISHKLAKSYKVDTENGCIVDLELQGDLKTYEMHILGVPLETMEARS